MKDKLDIIKDSLEENEAFLITGEANRFYLTGFKSSAGAVMITREKALLFADFRYFEKAKQMQKSFEVVMLTSLVKQIKSFCEDNGVKTVYTDTSVLPVSEFKAFSKALEGILLSDENKADKLLNEMRSVKSAEEIKRIKEAQRLTDETFSYIINQKLCGKSERDIMLDMEFYMRKAGSEGVAFDFIVVSGKNSSLPHGVPTDKRAEQGDFITMDFGAVVDGYRSDMTRTVAIGSVSEDKKYVYDTVLKAQRAAIAEIKSGVVCSDIDKIARDIINDAGFKGCFGHALGHSVGIDIHESPVFSPKCETVLKSSTVITVEPGIYIENKFGVRIEDMVVVNENGCIDITGSPSGLIYCE